MINLVWKFSAVNGSKFHNNSTLALLGREVSGRLHIRSCATISALPCPSLLRCSRIHISARPLRGGRGLTLATGEGSNAVQSWVRYNSEIQCFKCFAGFPRCGFRQTFLTCIWFFWPAVGVKAFRRGSAGFSIHLDGILIAAPLANNVRYQCRSLACLKCLRWSRTDFVWLLQNIAACRPRSKDRFLHLQRYNLHKERVVPWIIVERATY